MVDVVVIATPTKVHSTGIWLGSKFIAKHVALNQRSEKVIYCSKRNRLFSSAFTLMQLQFSFW
jgi:hypothetical protein